MAKAVWAAMLVGMGGSLGCMARYGLSLAGARLLPGWPLGTFAANCLGCLLMGLVTELAGHGSALSPEARLVLATGFCGGFTTMSAMVADAGRMLESGHLMQSAWYLGLTLAGSALAFALGTLAVRLALRWSGAGEGA